MSDDENSSSGCFSPELENQTPNSFNYTSSNRRRLFSSEGGASTSEGGANQQLEILRKIKASISNFSDRMDVIDTRLESVEKHQKEVSSPSGSSSVESVKRKVPAKVRCEVRNVYKVLLENEGFDIKKRFKDKPNQDVLKKIREEMQSLNPDIAPADIKDATQRFFQSKVDEASLKRKGKYSEKVKRTRQRNRICRKLELRKSTLMKASIPEDQKKMAMEPLVKEFMSSESSDEEELENNGGTQAVMVIKPLPWRGAKANRLFQRLDKHAKSQMLKQSLQQLRPRVIGATSTRPKLFQ